MRNKKATGFVGWMTYKMKDKENKWNKITNILAKYAEFSNTGGNKTGGYGVTGFEEKGGF